MVYHSYTLQCMYAVYKAGIEQEITIYLAKQVFALLWNAKTGHKDNVIATYCGRGIGLEYQCVMWHRGRHPLYTASTHACMWSISESPCDSKLYLSGTNNAFSESRLLP